MMVYYILTVIVPIAVVIYETVKERKRIGGIRKEIEELKEFSKLLHGRFPHS